MKPSDQNPTINNVPKIPSSILRTARVLQFISARLAANFAVKLFMTPFRFKTPEREKMMGKSAQKELIYIPELQKKVMVYTYGYSKKKALLIHGWSGRGTQLFKIADKLLENGYMTFSFDAPAHGKSEGKTSLMIEFIAVAKYLEYKYGPFEIAIGHSLGGMTVLNSVKQGLKIEKIVTIGAGDSITDIMKVFVSKLQLKEKIVDKMKRYFFKKYGEHIEDYSGNVAAASVEIPTLVIHDSEDKEVPVSCAHGIRQNLKQGELLITNGLGHTRILNDSTVVTRIMTFIKN